MSVGIGMEGQGPDLTCRAPCKPMPSSRSGSAAAEKINEADVSRVPLLTPRTPEIVEAIRTGVPPEPSDIESIVSAGMDIAAGSVEQGAVAPSGPLTSTKGSPL